MGLIVSLCIMAVVGLVVGFIARALMPGPNPMSTGRTILLGIGGSIVGGMIARLLHLGRGPGWGLSVVGALVLLWLLPKMSKV